MYAKDSRSSRLLPVLPKCARLGLGAGYTFHQDVFGAKVRLFGDVVYDQATYLPQVAVGVQYKVNNRRNVLRAELRARYLAEENT